MTYSDQEILTFEQIKGELLTLCSDKSTGDLCLFTAEKHAAVISFHQGEIVGLRYRISRGNDALRLIKRISQAKVRFQPGDPAKARITTTCILSTGEILRRLGVTQTGHGFQNEGKKVLVVEDSTTQRKIICRMLTENGFQIIEAKDGYEALSIVEYEIPDLVLLDIIMPGIDGYKVMASMKAIPNMTTVPIIMLTSRDKLIDKMRGR
ncbi:MAG: response regulator, partial [Gammaproteobacteria bacterium]|nr:response regulator [Gammaproteobacteria bacterium]